MSRIKLFTVLPVVFALLVLSAGVASAYIAWGWHWNALIGVGNATVMTKWTVVDGDPKDYFATIHVETADVEILKFAKKYETVTVKDQGECGVVKATFVVTGPKVKGNKRPVLVQLATGPEFRSLKPGAPRSAALGQKIKAKLTIPDVVCDGD